MEKCVKGFEDVLKGNGMGKRNLEEDRRSFVMKKLYMANMCFKRKENGK